MKNKDSFKFYVLGFKSKNVTRKTANLTRFTSVKSGRCL
jgi:hypothetical protein